MKNSIFAIVFLLHCVLALYVKQVLPDQSLDYWRKPIYCAHPHAWVLYCYYKLAEQ